MKRVLSWFQENSVALQGLAALIIIIGAVFAVGPYIVKAIQADILVRTNLDKNTLPPELAKWLKELATSVILDKSSLSKVQEANTRLYKAVDNPIISQMEDSRLEFDKLTIEIINQSGNVVSGLRLRLDSVYSLWNMDVAGTFLSPKESANFIEEAKNGYRGESLIFPELPKLPPNSTLKIIMFGNLEIAKPAITTIGNSYSLTKMAKVEDGFFLDWYRDPLKIFIFLPMILSVLFPFCFLAWRRIKLRVITRAINTEAPYILYNEACRAAKQERPDVAIYLLRQAVSKGYSDKYHALRDEDLESLRSRDEFKLLFEQKPEEAGQVS